MQQCLDRAAGSRAAAAEYARRDAEIMHNANSLYSMSAGREKDWAIHGGIADAIAGPAAGIAIAADIQQKNAQTRAANTQLAQSIGQITANAVLNNAKQERSAEKSAEFWTKEAEASKL